MREPFNAHVQGFSVVLLGDSINDFENGVKCIQGSVETFQECIGGLTALNCEIGSSGQNVREV